MKGFITRLFSAFACFKKVQAAGPLCSADEQQSCESKLAAVLKWWPKSNLELCEKCGVDEALQQRVEGCLTEVSGLRTSKVVQLLEAVVAAILETEPVLVAIDKTKKLRGHILRSHEDSWEGHREDAESIA